MPVVESTISPEASTVAAGAGVSQAKAVPSTWRGAGSVGVGIPVSVALTTAESSLSWKQLTTTIELIAINATLTGNNQFLFWDLFPVFVFVVSIFFVLLL
jgi:hypothetical protein